MKKTSMRPTKKLKWAQIKTPTKIKTAKCPSMRKLTKQLTPPKKKKIGLSTSREAPKKLKNTCKNRWYRAGLKHTEDWIGECQEELSSYRKKGGPKKIPDWHPWPDNKIKNRRPVGRTKRRWENNINDYLKPDEQRKNRSTISRTTTAGWRKQ